MKEYNIVVAGVGGQGTLLASRILARVLMDMGLDVKVSEVHGMAQRGGSVVTFVRGGEKIHSPLIHPGQADYLVSFEKLEAVRWMHMLANGRELISADTELIPSGVKVEYPQNLEERAEECQVSTLWLEAGEIAAAAGNAKAVNTVLLGALASRMDVPESIWTEAIRQEVPAKFLTANLTAFQQGWQRATEKFKGK